MHDVVFSFIIQCVIFHQIALISGGHPEAFRRRVGRSAVKDNNLRQLSFSLQYHLCVCVCGTDACRKMRVIIINLKKLGRSKMEKNVSHSLWPAQAAASRRQTQTIMAECLKTLSGPDIATTPPTQMLTGKS